MQRDELIQWLDHILETEAFQDASINGLQIEGVEEIH